MKKPSERIRTMSPEELRKLQLVLLDMLIELDRICRKRGIRYCIDGGTLLGAARHGGFIPWDDDVDVVMTRGEYERFREACESELDASKYFFQDHTTDMHYRWGYGRIRRKDSEFVRIGQEHMKMKTGIFLDIFPRDNVPDSYLSSFFHNIYCFLLRKLLYSEAGAVTGKNAFVRTLYRFLRLIPVKFTFRRLASLVKLSNSKNTLRMRTLTFPYPKKGLRGYKREWIEEMTEITFEGRVFICPKDYKEYLTCYYGDYMTPPPPEKRHWHPVSKFKLP